jgi:hypothetical protein
MGEDLINVARKTVMKSLGFLDNKYIRTILIILLIVYNSAIITEVNVTVSRFINIPLVKLLLVIAIVCLSLKDKVLSILLTMAVVMSTYYSVNTNEHFSMSSLTDKLREAMGTKEENNDIKPEMTQETRPEMTQETRPEMTQETRPEMTQETRPQMNNEQMTNAAGQNMMGMSNGPMGYSF